MSRDLHGVDYHKPQVCTICDGPVGSHSAGIHGHRCRHCATAHNQAIKRAAALTDEQKRTIAKRAVAQLMRDGFVRLRLFPGLNE